MKQDEIQFEILEDGTLKVTTPGISGTNHLSADNFLEQAERLIGATTDIKKRDRTKLPTVRTFGGKLNA